MLVTLICVLEFGKSYARPHPHSLGGTLIRRPVCTAAMSQKRFLFLLYCLHFDDSSTRGQRREADKFTPICKNYNQFVLACEAN